MRYQLINLETREALDTRLTMFAVRQQILAYRLTGHFQLNSIDDNGNTLKTLQIDDRFRDGKDRWYVVHDLEGEKTFGPFSCVESARKCVETEKLQDKHEIERVDTAGNTISRVQMCDAYMYRNTDDERVREGLGLR